MAACGGRAGVAYRGWLALCALTMAAAVLAAAGPARAQWSPPIKVAASGENPQLADDARGDAVAVWQDCVPGCGEQVLFTDYFAVGPLAPPSPVQISIGQGYLAQLASDPAGDAIAIFASPAGLMSSVRAASSREWQKPTPLGGATQATENAQLAVDSSGDAVAVWESSSFAIEAAYRSVSTGRWEGPVVISGEHERSYVPAVAIRDGGELAAAWRVYEPETAPCTMPSGVPCELILKNRDSLKVATRAPGAAWSVPVTLARTDSVEEPRIVLAGDGDATALWAQSTGAGRAIESALRPAGGAWQAPVTLSSAQLPYIGNGLDSGLQLAVDSEGDVTAVWRHEYPKAGGGLSGVAVLESALRSAHGSWEPPAAIPGSERRAGAGRLVENASGAAAEVWACNAGTSYPLIVRGAVRPSADAPWQPAVDISEVEGGFPAVAIAPDGSVTAIWGQTAFTTPGPPPGLYVSRYETARISPGAPQTNACASPAAPSAAGPVLSHVHMSHARFRAGRAATAITAALPVGTDFLFHLSVPAGVRIELLRVATGQRRGRTCVSPTRRGGGRHAPTCQLLLGSGTLSRRSEQAGADRVAFSGRVGRRSLRPGAYVGRLVAVGAGGASQAAALRFTIVR